MKFPHLVALIFSLVLFSLSANAENTAKRPGKSKSVRSEIDDATEDIEVEQTARAKDKAEKKDAIRYATSVQDELTPEEKQKYIHAIPALEKKVKAMPADAKSQLQLGKAYLISGNFEKAVTHLKEASQIPSPSTMYLLAEAYRGKKDYLNEIRTLNVILQTDENDAKANELLGTAYFATKNIDKAIQSYRRSVAIDPHRRTAYNGLLKVFDNKNNRYESRQVYLDMLKAFGKDEQAYSGLCKLFSQDNFADSGVENCLKAIEINPNIPDNHVYLGMIYKFKKDTAQASKILTKAAKQFSHSELANWAAGQLGDDMKNWESAKFYYRKCVEVDPKSARCYRRLAMISFELKDYGESLKAYSVACRLDKTTLVDIRNATSELRIQNKEDWKNKFQTASDKCGF